MIFRIFWRGATDNSRGPHTHTHPLVSVYDDFVRSGVDRFSGSLIPGLGHLSSVHDDNDQLRVRGDSVDANVSVASTLSPDLLFPLSDSGFALLSASLSSSVASPSFASLSSLLPLFPLLGSCLQWLLLSLLLLFLCFLFLLLFLLLFLFLQLLFLLLLLIFLLFLFLFLLLRLPLHFLFLSRLLSSILFALPTRFSAPSFIPPVPLFASSFPLVSSFFSSTNLLSWILLHIRLVL